MYQHLFLLDCLQRTIAEKNFEDERKTMKKHIFELERKLEGTLQALTVAESTITMRDAELEASQINMKELEELREMKEVLAFLYFLMGYELR